jgi:hypothetical protein
VELLLHHRNRLEELLVRHNRLPAGKEDQTARGGRGAGRALSDCVRARVVVVVAHHPAGKLREATLGNYYLVENW